MITNELYGLREETREVLAPMVADGYLHVLDRAVALEDIWQIRRHIQNVLYPVARESLTVLAVCSITQIQMRQNLHWEILVFLWT